MNPSPEASRPYLSPEHYIQPPGQKFPIGARVRLLIKGAWICATVLGSHAQSCIQQWDQTRGDVSQYSLYIDGIGFSSWHEESALELVPPPHSIHSVPSPEAVAIAKQIIGTIAVRDLAEIVDETLAPERERVRRLVEAAEQAKRLRGLQQSLSTTTSHAKKDSLLRLMLPIEEELDAALAPFLEQETVTP